LKDNPIDNFLVTTRELPLALHSKAAERRLNKSSSIFSIFIEGCHGEVMREPISDGIILCGRPWFLDRLIELPRELVPSKIIDWNQGANGGWVLLDVGKKAVTIAIDPIGALPIFFIENRGDITISSREDWCLMAAGRTADLDLVSLCELMQGGGITFPHAMFHGVRQLAPGTIVTVDQGAGLSVERWHQLGAMSRRRSRIEVANEIREIVVENIASVLATEAKCGLLLSSGADSRAIAGAISALGFSNRVEAFHLIADGSHEEYLAKAIADSYGLGFHAISNGSGAYLDRAQSPLVSGGTPLVPHSHFIGAAAKVREVLCGEKPVVFGGLLGDLLKGPRLAKVVRSRIIRGLKGHRISRLPVGDEYKLEADKRRKVHENTVKDLFDAELVSRWASYWPLSNYSSFGCYLFARLAFRPVEPFMDQRILWSLFSTTDSCRRGRTMSELAFSEFYSATVSIPTSNGEMFGGRGVPFVPRTKKRNVTKWLAQNSLGQGKPGKLGSYSWPGRHREFVAHVLKNKEEILSLGLNALLGDQDFEMCIERLPMRGVAALVQALTVCSRVNSKSFLVAPETGEVQA